MLNEWQDYENIKNEPDNIKAVELILSKNKPHKNSKGFITKNNFQYKKPKDGLKLWIRFWEF